MKIFRFRITFLLLLSITALLSCKASLAPAYDRAIFEGVTENGELAMRFFAEVDGGTDSESFFRRQLIYNQLIGAFESLKLQAKARPVPKNMALDKINLLLQARGSTAITDDYPSAFAFGEIANTFRKMKQTDSQNGIKPLAVQAFKGQVEIYLDQAITYESFLKR